MAKNTGKVLSKTVQPSVKISAKTHLKEYRGLRVKIVALCDSHLLGKILEEGDTTIDLKAYKSFYEGDIIGESKAIELLKSAENVNAVGKASVRALQSAFKFDPARIKRVKGIPHMQIYKL